MGGIRGKTNERLEKHLSKGGNRKTDSWLKTNSKGTRDIVIKEREGGGGREEIDKVKHFNPSFSLFDLRYVFIPPGRVNIKLYSL
jgi:hypothetical protein